ncbi:hypothetical protein NPIL_71081 [Nephila pilipes]|uniref:Uncharacterized protein n=1 Tax=Nephila pilipes TaxID=299642 RepID=A0A8X6T5W4_NEPPI|nr:hypothetical protein NPIL_71081 [Nephila pilipes]
MFPCGRMKMDFQAQRSFFKALLSFLSQFQHHHRLAQHLRTVRNRWFDRWTSKQGLVDYILYTTIKRRPPVIHKKYQNPNNNQCASALILLTSRTRAPELDSSY